MKKRENRDDLDLLQMNGYVPCGIISIWVYFFLPETSACDIHTVLFHSNKQCLICERREDNSHHLIINILEQIEIK